MADESGAHRGAPHPLEFSVGRWTLFALCALLAGVLIVDDTGWRLAVGIGLFTVAMVGFYVASRIIARGYPDLDEDD